MISIFVSVGAWFERFIMAGSVGWFFMWFLLFVKDFPAVVAESS